MKKIFLALAFLAGFCNQVLPMDQDTITTQAQGSKRKMSIGFLLNETVDQKPTNLQIFDTLAANCTEKPGVSTESQSEKNEYIFEVRDNEPQKFNSQKFVKVKGVKYANLILSDKMPNNFNGYTTTCLPCNLHFDKQIGIKIAQSFIYHHAKNKHENNKMTQWNITKKLVATISCTACSAKIKASDRINTIYLSYKKHLSFNHPELEQSEETLVQHVYNNCKIETVPFVKKPAQSTDGATKNTSIKKQKIT